MNKIFSQTKLSTLFLGVALAILGFIFIINPTGSIMFIVKLVGFLLLLFGAITLLRWYMQKRNGFENPADLLFGLIETVPAILIIVAPDMLVNLLYVVLGLIILFTGINDIVAAREAQRIDKHLWQVDMVISIITLVLGIFVVISPFVMAQAVAIIVGVALLFDGITEVVAALRM